MRYKKELYEKEQAEIVDEILEILSLKENKITLYELENDLEKQEKIINLIFWTTTNTQQIVLKKKML